MAVEGTTEATRRHGHVVRKPLNNHSRSYMELEGNRKKEADEDMKILST